jgi:hypothetical protein
MTSVYVLLMHMPFTYFNFHKCLSWLPVFRMSKSLSSIVQPWQCARSSLARALLLTMRPEQGSLKGGPVPPRERE